MNLMIRYLYNRMLCPPTSKGLLILSLVANNSCFLQMSEPLVVCETDGSGLWSSKRAKVRVTKLELHLYGDEEKTFGSLHAFFDTKDWDVEKMALSTLTKDFIMIFTLS